MWPGAPGSEQAAACFSAGAAAEGGVRTRLRSYNVTAWFAGVEVRLRRQRGTCCGVLWRRRHGSGCHCRELLRWRGLCLLVDGRAERRPGLCTHCRV